MGLEKPLRRIDVLAALDETQPVRTAVGHKQVDLTHHAEARVREGRVSGKLELPPAVTRLRVRFIRRRVADADLLGKGLSREVPEVGISLVNRLPGVADRGLVVLNNHAAG